MPPDDRTPHVRPASEAAARDLATPAVENISGVDFASIALYSADHTLRTVAASDPLSERTNVIQYHLHKGPCYAAVTPERLVLVNDVAAPPSDFPSTDPARPSSGCESQAALQLTHNGERAGLNLYAHQVRAFDRSTVQLAELFATQAAACSTTPSRSSSSAKPSTSVPKSIPPSLQGGGATSTGFDSGVDRVCH